MKRCCVWLLILIMGGVFPSFAHAQDSTPEDADPLSGVRLYQARCATCHGPLGLGDGRLAENLPVRPEAIGSPEYLEAAAPQAIYDAIYNGNLGQGMPGFGPENNSNPLTEAEIWDIIAGLSRLSILSETIPTLAVVGQLSHAENLPVPEGALVTLQAFDPEANEALRLETTAGGDGSYRFGLQQIPPNWVIRTAVRYQGVDFTSALTPVDPLSPEVELPITLFETTMAADDIHIPRLTLLIEFVEDRVQVAELYLFENRGLTVYTGPTGDPAEGTLMFPFDYLDQTDPAGLRGFDGGTSLLPLDLIEQPNELVLGVPIGPGPEALSFILRYDLPYAEVVSAGGLTRRVNYPVDQIDLVIPDVGVAVSGPGWNGLGSIGGDALEDGLNRLRFGRPGIAPGETFAISLEGRPARVIDANGRLVINPDPDRDLVWGGVALGLAAVAAVVLIWQWRTAPPEVADRDDLLLRIAALDDAYEQGKLPRRAYLRRRGRLLNTLREIWDA